MRGFSSHLYITHTIRHVLDATGQPACMHAGRQKNQLTLTRLLSPLGLAGRDQLIPYRSSTVLDHVVEHGAVTGGVRVHRSVGVDLLKSKQESGWRRACVCVCVC